MDSYRYEQIASLAGQLRFCPTHQRAEQLEQARNLLAAIEPGRQYPFEFLCSRITGYRPDGPEAGNLLDGAAAALDVARLIESVSATLDQRPQDVGEPVLTAEQLAEEYHVSGKTVSRWRRRGLVGRLLRFADGRRRMAFLKGDVERFVATHARQVARGRRFSRMSRSERDGIVQRARQLTEAGCRSLNQLVGRIARETGRAAETVRYTLRSHDRRDPRAAVCPAAEAGPLGEEDCKALYRGYLGGMSVEQLAARHRRSRSAIYRAIRQQRTAAICRRQVEFVFSSEFEDPDAERLILGAAAPRPDRPARRRQAPRDLPTYLRSLYGHDLLTREQEADLFRRYNYLKYLAARRQHELSVRPAATEDLDRFESLMAAATTIKNRIIQCNLRLVVSIAKRHVGRNADLFELISDGNLSLMKAVERFDYARGNRFSTYASWAIIKNYARTIPEDNYRLERLQTGREELLDLIGRIEPAGEAASDQATFHRQIQAGLGLLDERERGVIERRFGLDGQEPPKTLGQVGVAYGVSKERVRQIEARALGKLRAALDGKKLGILP